MSDSERGAAALMVAGALIAIFGFAALAVDTSGFYQTARVSQTTADLACLAGAAELDVSHSAAITAAMDFTEANWPGIRGSQRMISGSTGSLSDGVGNAVLYDAGYGSDQMRLQVTNRDPATFGRVIGATEVDIVQEAVCERSVEATGGGIPFMAPTGGFGGALQISPPCGPSSGNCGALYIERADTNGQGNTLIKNISNGPDRILSPWLGNGAGATHCNNVSAGGTCHMVETDTGSSQSHLGNGFFDRLNGDPTASCTYTYRGGTLNCDTPTQVLGGSPTSLFAAFPSRPGWWNVGLYGPYSAASTAQHYWYNGIVAKCDSKLLAGMPIATPNSDWDLGDPHLGFPSGSSVPVKIVGFYNVIVTDPDESGDFHGNKNLDFAAAIVIWFGPSATCANGDPIGVLNGVLPGMPVESVKLIEP